MSLPQTFDLAHRMCPTAYLVVVGTKADLRTKECVTTAEAEVITVTSIMCSFCVYVHVPRPIYMYLKLFSNQKQL